VLAQSERFTDSVIASEIDVKKLRADRRRMSTYGGAYEEGCAEGYRTVPFSVEVKETQLTRTFAAHPFVPADKARRRRALP